MASFDFQIPQGLIDDLRKCGDIDRIAPIMLKEGAKIVKKAVENRVRLAYSSPGRKVQYIIKSSENSSKGYRLGEYEQSGSLLKSIRTSKPDKNKNGVYNLKIYFAGYDKGEKKKNGEYSKVSARYPKGIPQNEKAIIIEYGKTGQMARPFIQASINDSEAEAVAKMQQIYNEEVQNGR